MRTITPPISIDECTDELVTVKSQLYTNSTSLVLLKKGEEDGTSSGLIVKLL